MTEALAMSRGGLGGDFIVYQDERGIELLLMGFLGAVVFVRDWGSHRVQGLRFGDLTGFSSSVKAQKSLPTWAHHVDAASFGFGANSTALDSIRRPCTSEQKASLRPGPKPHTWTY